MPASPLKVCAPATRSATPDAVVVSPCLLWVDSRCPATGREDRGTGLKAKLEAWQTDKGRQVEHLLEGVAWNELSEWPELNESLLSVLAKDRSGVLKAIGTAFAFQADSTGAWALSAAHVFSEIQRLQAHEHQVAHPSALVEFLPPPPPVNIELGGLVLVAQEGTRAIFYRVDGLAFDAAADIGVAKLSLQPGDPEFHAMNWLVDDEPPALNEIVGVASFLDLNTLTLGTANSFQFSRRPVVRIGRVTAVFPGGERLCRGPCFETSIPMYSGMSGGPVVRFKHGKVAAIGVVCADPDADGPEKNNRSIAGRSLVACIPATRMSGTLDSLQEVAVSFQVTASTGSFV